MEMTLFDPYQLSLSQKPQVIEEICQHTIPEKL